MSRLHSFVALTGLVALAASQASASFSTTAVTADYYSYGGGFSNNGYYIINNGFQNGAASNEAITFLKFDSTALPASLGVGEKAYLSVTKYGNPFLTNSTDAKPIKIGVSGLTTLDVSTVSDSSGIDGLKGDLGASVAEGDVGGSRVYSFDVTALVAQWISNPSSNLGVALHARNDFNPQGGSLSNPYFVSSDGPHAAHVSSGYVASDALRPTLSSVAPAGATIIAAVPEPASLAALALGAVALRRRRK